MLPILVVTKGSSADAKVKVGNKAIERERMRFLVLNPHHAYFVKFNPHASN